MKIIIVDDEIQLQSYIIRKLINTYSVDIASNAKRGLYLIKHGTYQTIILDILLPDINGIELCKQIRDQGITTPIIMLSAEESIGQKTKAFHFGADDYMTKPFSLEELDLRIQSLQRRNQYIPQKDKISIGSFNLDTTNRVLLYKNIEVKLSRKEFDTLEILVKQINFTVSRKHFADSLWNEEALISSNSIDVHVGNLKRKLQKISNEICIKSVSGIGYVLFLNKNSTEKNELL